MASEYNILRTAFANFAPTTAGDYVSDAIIPAGAVVKSITSVEGTALAGGTNVTFEIGSQALTAAIELASFTGVDTHALTDTDGLEVTASAPLQIATTGTFTTGDIDVYVEYYFTEDHT